MNLYGKSLESHMELHIWVWISFANKCSFIEEMDHKMERLMLNCQQ